MSRFIEFNNPPVQYLTIEDHVNAYVVGDLHGCYEELMKELDRINFDKSRDILICVGDLIDRGKSSEKIIALLDEPWFVSVLGNHEQLCMQGNVSYSYEQAHKEERSGGTWFYNLPKDVRDRYVEKFLKLPIILEIKYKNKKYGIVHADVPTSNWNRLKRQVINNSKHKDGRTIKNHCLWARNLVHHKSANIRNIDRVYLGHSVVPHACNINDIKNVGNCTFIDTGCVYGLWLSIVKLGDKKVC